MTVTACNDWPTNGHLIEALVELGHLSPADSVLDLTYGRGGWWRRFRPAELVAHDLHRLDGVDFRSTPHPDASFDVVAFDPPYIESRSARSTLMRDGVNFLDRYGLDRGPNTFRGVWDLIAGGLLEAARVVRPGGVVLVKCMNYQSGRRFRPVPMMVVAFAEGLGLDIVDELIHRRPTGPGDYEIQHTARRNTSTMLVLRRRRRRARSGTTARDLTFANLAGATVPGDVSAGNHTRVVRGVYSVP